MSLAEAQEKVREFHRKNNQLIRDSPSLRGVPIDTRKLRMKLLDEEFQEYMDAEFDWNLVEIADALADQIYIILGTANSYGIELGPVFDEVHRANMEKPTERREDGKIKKPEDFECPRIQKLLEEQK